MQLLSQQVNEITPFSVKGDRRYLRKQGGIGNILFILCANMGLLVQSHTMICYQILPEELKKIYLTKK